MRIFARYALDKRIRAVNFIVYLDHGVLKKAYVRPSVAAYKVAVVVHLFDYLGALFDLAAHEEEARFNAALAQAVKKLLRVLSRAVVKGERNLIF